MSFTSWLLTRWSQSPRTASRSNTRAARPARRTFRPGCECLEERRQLSTLMVTNTLDSGKHSLRAEIAAAHSGDTINFNLSTNDPGYNSTTGCWTIGLKSGELLINKNLTIAGPGPGQLTIDGGGKGRVFEVAKPTGKVNLNLHVNLSGLTISDGFGGPPGSGISGDGGGILNEGTLTVSNCIVSGNSAGFGGAGIFNYFGALTVNNSTLSGNTASTALGGGVFNWQGMVTLNDCIVSGNSAASAGGGFLNDGGTTTIHAGEIFGNSAGQGGGIENEGTLTIDDGCVLHDNTARLTGGAILNFFTLTIDHCNLDHNSAEEGGGISNRLLSGPNGTPANTVTVSGCTFTANNAAERGGGIYNGTNLADALLVSNSTFGDQFDGSLANTPDNIFGLFVDEGGNNLY